jgi:uncharacterized SAM-binding protein YcdF (DUF218 family)
MSFIASEPLVMFFLLSGVGLVLRFRARRAGNSIIFLAVFALYCLSTPFFSSLLLNALQHAGSVAQQDEGFKPQTIVVLGADLRRAAPEYGGDTAGRLTLERIRFAAKLHRQTSLPILVTGAGSPTKSVALAMKEALNGDFGVEVKWVEQAARTTFENAQLSSALLRKFGVSTVYLVTHAWHMPRSLEAFEKAGLKVVAAPTAFTPVFHGTKLTGYIPFAKALTNSSYAFHEFVGRMWYRLALYE